MRGHPDKRLLEELREPLIKYFGDFAPRTCEHSVGPGGVSGAELARAKYREAVGEDMRRDW